MSNELFHLVKAKLTRRGSLSLATVKRVADAFEPLDQTAAAEDLIVQGVRASSCLLLLDGFAARYRLLESGRRQFTDIVVPGDFINLGTVLKKRQPQSVLALTDCTTVSLAHPRLELLIDSDPDLTKVLWLETLVDGAIGREWIFSLGAQSAKARLARFLCEMYCRLEVVERAADDSFRLPLTQVQVSDALGLSAVHVNRVVSEMRNEGLIAWSGQRVRLRQWRELASLAEFDGAYLELPPRST